jgi:hypothetical protein
MTPNSLNSAWEQFSDMRRASTMEDLTEWLFRNSPRLYENGRNQLLARAKQPVECPAEPTWTFASLKLDPLRTIQREEDGPVEGATLATFTILGSDPFLLHVHMWQDIGFKLRTASAGWHDMTASLILSSEDWPSMFVRQKLESLDG